MYNLLVSADPDAWNGEPHVLGTDRVLEHTVGHLRERFLPLSENSYVELQSYPAVFAHEKSAHTPAKLGRIDRVRTRRNDVQIRYTLFDLPAIDPETLMGLAWELDIGDWEMNRTHWAVKDVDLREVIVEQGLVNSDQLARIDAELFRKAADEPLVEISPRVFRIPDQRPDPKLVSVMMPFSPKFTAVFETLEAACDTLDLTCRNANQIWEESEIIQDIFNLIYRSAVVICDFTDRNPNVFYEAGIAHTLGRPVIPITQTGEHIPFDLSHHRYIDYLNNEEGRKSLEKQVRTRLATLTGN